MLGWLKRKLARRASKIVFNRLAIPRAVQTAVFNFWRWEMALIKKYAVPRGKPLTLVHSGVPWFDGLVCATEGGRSGCPGGTWLIWTGEPGVGKTTAALNVLNAMCMQPQVEGWHVDFEMGRVKARQMYEQFDYSSISNYVWEPDPTGLLTGMEARANELAARGWAMVVLVDSFKAFGTSLEAMKEAALAIKSMRERCPNLILMTVNHKTGDKKKTEGPASLPQWCDIVLELKPSGMFMLIGTPAKNRWAAPDSPKWLKLKRDPEKIFVISAEPDFISDNPVVKFVRGLPGRWPFKRG